jgi:hypothetical protein
MVFLMLSVAAAVGAGMALLRRVAPSVGDESSDEVNLSTIGEGRVFRSKSAAFRGGSWLAVMGATKIDLRQATAAPEGARLQLQAVMSAVKVLVPENWVVRTELECMSSAVENRTLAAGEPADARPDLVVTGKAIMSAVAVANKAGADELESEPGTVSPEALAEAAPA